ncbi:MAG: hypothetical protein JW966_00920 [Anaerolineae bacterium]|nr:hypothetical protein [Anaerolineae bacterium]
MTNSLFKNRTQSHLQDFLIAHADALATDTLNLDYLLEQYGDIALSQVEDLLALAERISKTLLPVVPSHEFVEELRRQLDNQTSLISPPWWERIRQLSPRVQLAAVGIGGATLTAAGVVIIARRPVIDALTGKRTRRTSVA